MRSSDKEETVAYHEGNKSKTGERYGIVSDNKTVAVKEDWENYPMPEKNASFTIQRSFTDEETDNLREGHIPRDMDDRWFTYFENNKLYIHRSWSGICIYIVEFPEKSKCIFKREANKHRVIVNRDDTQYTCKDIEEDKIQLNALLDYFVL